MNKKGIKRGKFIQLYRTKLQNDLDEMGYPGAIENEAGSIQPVIVDAGSELSNLNRDSVANKRRKAVQP